VIKELIQKHQRKISAGALLVGFLWDTITLTRIDYLFEVIVLGTHTALIILWILLINLVDGKVLTWGIFKWIRNIAPILMQVSFGALFSGLTVFYVKSASFGTSFIFVLVLAAILIGNEFFRTRYQRFIFQFSILYVALASFFALYLPVLVESVGWWVFVGANIVAGGIIYALVSFLSLFLKEKVTKSRNGLRISIASIFTLLLVLYFSNIIPPVPLSLKHKGIYHDISRVGVSYIVDEEQESLFETIIPGKTIHIQEGDSVSMFSSIFAPTGLSTSISHAWDYYDAQEKKWIPQGKISFPITGGRDNGFRGYTEKSISSEGRWRVRVVTKRNQVLGISEVTVVYVNAPVEVQKKEL
jgi:hypothetical protein